MAKIRIEYNDISSSCSSLTNLAEKMEGIITNINNAIAKITDPTWDGMAAQSYVEKIKQVANNLPDAKVQIASSALFLASCADGYKSMDKESYNKLIEMVGGQSYIDSYDVSKAPDIDLNSRIKVEKEEENPVESNNYVDSELGDDYSGGGGGSSGGSSSGDSLSELFGDGFQGGAGIVSAISDGIIDISSIKEGEEIKIPDTINQAYQSVIGFDANLETEEERVYTEEERKIIEQWKAQGSKYTNGIATIEINGETRYLVSVSKKFGVVGDSIDINMKDGSVAKCIIFENKKLDSTTTSSVYGDSTKDEKINIVNYEVSSEKYKELGEFTKEKWELDWDPSSPVTKIKNNGSVISNKKNTSFENTSNSNEINDEMPNNNNNDDLIENEDE